MFLSFVLLAGVGLARSARTALGSSAARDAIDIPIEINGQIARLVVAQGGDVHASIERFCR
jgi:hypothetical protein